MPPLLSERSRNDRIVALIVLPAVFGAVTGFFVGTSEGIYIVLSLLALVGAVTIGLQTLGSANGLPNGALAGVIFGTFVLLAHEIHGEEAKANLPDPAILLVGVTTAVGGLAAALGGWIRLRAADEPVSDRS